MSKTPFQKKSFQSSFQHGIRQVSPPTQLEQSKAQSEEPAGTLTGVSMPSFKLPLQKLILIVALCLPFCAFANRVAVSALTDPFGQAGALMGGGTATVNDMSAADFNPAGLALSKEVSLTGEAKWRDSSTLAVEAGVLDSLMSEIAAGLKARMSTKASGAKDRRFTLGLAERLAGSPVVVGIAGDYQQIQRSQTERSGGKSKTKDTPRLRAGGLYNFSENFLLGVSTDGWLDNINKEKRHAIGLGLAFAGYYLLNADVLFKDTSPDQTVFGLTLGAKEYLDLRVGYRYGLDSKIHSGAAGVTLKSQQFRLYYTLSRPILRQGPFFHQIGAGLIVTM
jgi:hypothetical protein